MKRAILLLVCAALPACSTGTAAADRDAAAWEKQAQNITIIRDNWGIKPLASRDTAAKSFMDAFDFSKAPRAAELLPASRALQKTQRNNQFLLYSAYGFAVFLALGTFVLSYYSLAIRRRRATA